MNGLPYYKAYPRDFIEGTVGMSFELKAAYRLVLDLIYMQGGNLVDDARYISGMLGCSVKKWNSLRDQLVSGGKIEVREGFLGNLRADKEIETLGKFQDKQRENRSRPNKINMLESPRCDHTEPDTEPKKETEAVARGESEQINPAALAEKMFEAGGKALNRTTAALENFSEPFAWIEQGADLERDILPTIRDIGGRMIANGRTISGWGYFTKAVAEAKNRRQATAGVFANAEEAPAASVNLGFKLDPSTPRYCQPAPGSELLEIEEPEETPFMRNWKNRVLKGVGDARH